MAVKVSVMCLDCNEIFESSSVFSLKENIDGSGGFLLIDRCDKGFILEGECPECSGELEFKVF